MITLRAPRAPRRYHPLFNLIVARLREFVREPHAVFWVYVFPLILMSALGIAFGNRPLAAMRVVVIEGPRAESICAQLQSNPQFEVTLCSQPEASRLFRTNEAELLIAASDGSAVSYEYTFDPSRSDSLLAKRMADDCLQTAAGRRDVVESRDLQIDAPGAHYADFLLPGLLGMSLMSGGLVGVGYAVVDLRVRKLLKHYYATPVRRSHFLASIMCSRFLFTAGQVLVLLVFAKFIFGVSNLGSALTLALIIVLAALEFSGVGLLIGSRAQTMETLSGLMNAIMLPMCMGSGIFFSIERFPALAQCVLYLLPLTPVIHALRSVMLEGAGLASVSGDLALIAVWGAASFAIALRWFRWK